jgi:two-component system cell cycle sensor histidine kinase PleC
MERLSRVEAGRAALFACSIPLAIAAALLDLLPSPVAVVLGIAPLMGFLIWELSSSRRALIQEHAAHMSKSTYLADMSHELRTPLNAIIGFSELIRDEVLGPCDNAKYREFAHDIHEASTHLLHLINDVLELSKIEAGRLELNEDEADLKVLLVSCQRLLQEQARRAGLQLTMDIAPDLAEVYCDPLKIKQVVLNLMSNAIKFTHRGGCVWVHAYRTDGKVAISISDNGVGIPANEITRALTPFAQAAHTRLLTKEGTGLGLPLSKRLMELHGGQLELQSDVGIGTRVTLTFPSERCRRPAGWPNPSLCEAAASA